MMVCWFLAASVRVENLANCTSGMPVMVANMPLAVEKCGVKQRLKNKPLSQRLLMYGVAFSALPLMLVLYMLKDSQTTNTTFGFDAKYLEEGFCFFLYEVAALSQPIQSLK